MKLVKTVLTLMVWAPLWDIAPSFAEQKRPPYLGTQRLSCLTQPHMIPHSAEYEKGAKEAQAALEKPYTSDQSVWFQEIFKYEPRLKTVIEEFLSGKRGQAAKSIKLSGKTAQELHKELIAAGFQYKRLPLLASGTEKRGKFWRRDGTKTTDGNDPEVVPMDVYSHPDGSLIRVKPEGVPSQRYPRPEPSATKSVVYNLDLIVDKDTQEKTIDTRFKNEAFKISEKGVPLPKGPSAKVGLRLLYTRKQIKEVSDIEGAKQKQKGWIDTVMNEVHTDLVADYSHCTSKHPQH